MAMNKQERARERRNRKPWKIPLLKEITVREVVWEALSQQYNSLPTKADWDAFIAEGWTSDGVTSAPDKLCGVNIGSKGDETKFWPPKPATLHDYMFQKGGCREDFKIANKIFRDYLLLYLMPLRNPRTYSERRVRRAVGYYYWGVRTRFAFRAFNLIPLVLIGKKII